MTDLNYSELSRALVTYIQFKKAKWPQTDKDAVIREFGENKATVLLNQIKELVGEVGAIKVDWTKYSLAFAADFVRAEMKKRHPKLSSEAVDALAWKWSFESK